MKVLSDEDLGLADGQLQATSAAMAREVSAMLTARSVIDLYRGLKAAIERSGFDLSPCGNCGETVVCIPDGLPMCESCAAEEMANQ